MRPLFLLHAWHDGGKGGGGHILTAFMASATLYKDTTCRMWSYFHMPLVSLRCLPWDGAYLELVAAGSNYCPGMARTWDQLPVPTIAPGWRAPGTS